METVHILVVEDERIVALDIKNTLEKLGHASVTLASSSAEALSAIASERTHLVLMDILLKGEKDGIETAGYILTHYNIPVIYITALADETTLERAKSTQPYGYIIKPFKERDLHTAIEMALSKHKMEVQLKESETKFRTLFEKAANPNFLIKDGIFIDCNQSALDLLKYSRKEDLIGKTPAHISPERQSDGTFSRDKIEENNRLAARGIVRSFEWDHITSDGTVFPTEVMLSTIPLHGETILHSVVKDLTQQKKVEENLRANEERYRSFFEEDLTGDFITDFYGNIIACNPAFRRIFGLDAGENPVMVKFPALFPDYDEWENFKNNLIHSKKLVYHEVALQRINGSPVFVVGNFLGNFEPNESFNGIQGYIFDDTERKKLEQKFLQAQKMEAVGRLAGGIAHDFNNLLTVINGYSEYLLATMKDGSTDQEAIKEIKQAGERAAMLTRQLLVFSRHQIIQPQIIDLNNIVNNIQKLLRRLIGENIDIIIQLDRNLGKIEADPGQMEQVIMNLVVNARDAMPGGGKLVITTANRVIKEEGDPEFPEAKPGAYRMLSVSDNGSGIDEKTRQHIFEPFFTTKAKGEGTGLGLSTVYGIVTQSNGVISLDSRPGIGTTFSILFPQPTVETVEREQDRSQTRPAGGNETILVVEDENAVRNFIIRVLSINGYGTLSARNGEEAIKTVKGFDKTLHLVISDIVMPGLNGPDTVKEIRQLHPDIRVLFITGYTDQKIPEKLEENEAIVLQKPFNPEELTLKVRTALDRR